MSKKMKIAILGTGASALFAAKAAKDAGHEPLIIGIKEFSFPPGPFWFHWVPDDVKAKMEGTKITVIPEGRERKYQSLQWGKVPNGVKSSFPDRVAVVVGYNPSETAELMSSMFMLKLPQALTDAQIRNYCEEWDLVFQTFPTKESKAVQQHPLMPYYVGALYNAGAATDNYVVYNGTGTGIWLRKVFLWGNLFFEFPKNLELDQIKPVMDRTYPNLEYHKLYDMHPGTKPIQLPLSAPMNLHLVGRWAEWNTKRLSHEAYKIVKEIIQRNA